MPVFSFQVCFGCAESRHEVGHACDGPGQVYTGFLCFECVIRYERIQAGFEVFGQCGYGCQVWNSVGCENTLVYPGSVVFFFFFIKGIVSGFFGGPAVLCRKYCQI